MNRRIRMLFAAALLSSANVTASPTANEFSACHKQAAALLLQCLEQRPGYQNEHCWKQSRQANQACYAEVASSHRPDPARIEAEKKARAAAGK